MPINVAGVTAVPAKTDGMDCASATGGIIRSERSSSPLSDDEWDGDFVLEIDAFTKLLRRIRALSCGLFLATLPAATIFRFCGFSDGETTGDST